MALEDTADPGSLTTPDPQWLVDGNVGDDTYRVMLPDGRVLDDMDVAFTAEVCLGYDRDVLYHWRINLKVPCDGKRCKLLGWDQDSCDDGWHWVATNDVDHPDLLSMFGQADDLRTFDERGRGSGIEGIAWMFSGDVSS